MVTKRAGAAVLLGMVLWLGIPPSSLRAQIAWPWPQPAGSEVAQATTTTAPTPAPSQAVRPKSTATPRALTAARTHAQRTEQLNQNTVTVISGNPNGTYLFLAYDLSAVLDEGEELRVLPVIGKGGYQNVLDILHLRGVDLGITQSNIMTYLKKTGELGSNIDQRLAYIAKLYNEELHVLAGPGIEKLEDLNGRIVNFSDVGSGTQFSTRLIFEQLGIKAEEINVGQSDGYLKVKTGEIAATVLIAGKPAGSFAKFKLEPGMKILPVPYVPALEADYFPATLTHEDYPTLIPQGKSIDTVAVGAVLAVYNWPRDTDRYRRVQRFTERFFARFDQFPKPPRHTKWKETNLAAPLKGWQRFPAAQEQLDRMTAAAARTAAQAPAPAVAGDSTRATAAGTTSGSASEQEQLFREFLEWRKTQRKP
jgi:uncharacterized protein